MTKPDIGAPVKYVVNGVEDPSVDGKGRTELASYTSYHETVRWLRKYVMKEDAGGWTYFEIVAVDAAGVSMPVLELETEWFDN